MQQTQQSTLLIYPRRKGQLETVNSLFFFFPKKINAYLQSVIPVQCGPRKTALVPVSCVNLNSVQLFCFLCGFVMYLSDGFLGQEKSDILSLASNKLYKVSKGLILSF